MTANDCNTLAHIHHVELLTPAPAESERFFVDVLGMEEEAREGQSVYLRGWGDYLRYSLKLTESPRASPSRRRRRSTGSRRASSYTGSSPEGTGSR